MAKHLLAVLAVGVLAMATGCHAIDFYTPSLQKPIPAGNEPPRELSMVSLPVYRIAPPDVIRIEVVKLVPRASYRIGPSDMLLIRVLGTLREPADRQAVSRGGRRNCHSRGAVRDDSGGGDDGRGGRGGAHADLEDDFETSPSYPSS